MSAEQDLDTVAPFVAALVVSHGRLALFSARDARAYPFVLQRFSEPIGVVTPVPKQPVDIRQAAEQCPRPDVIADLSGGDKEVDRAAFAIADGMQLGIHAALGATDQAATPPFLRPGWTPSDVP